MTIARTETHKAANTAQYHRASVAAQESELEVVVGGLAQTTAELEMITKTRTGKQGQLVNRLMLVASC